MDAKDILGLPKNALPIPQEKKSRPPKEPQRKPDGISREVYMLTGGVAPLMPSIDASQLKQRPPAVEKVTWQWLSFTNSARKDNLQLYHWVRVVNGVPPTGDYPFAKYNKAVDVVKYTDEEYEKYLTDPTVYVPYNAQQETDRKRSLSLVLSQTKRQERKDAEVLAEAKKIQESHMLAKGAEEQEGPSTPDDGAENIERPVVPSGAVSPLTGATSMVAADNVTTPASLRMLRVYLRTYALEQMVQAASSTAGLRTIKRVEQTLQDLGVNLKPKVPTKAVCAEHLELRKEILTLLNLQKHLQYKETEGPSYRDSSCADTPGTPKRPLRSGDQDRPFIQEPSTFGADRVGKREQKRKGPGRLPEAPSAAATKRVRKLKSEG